jgi:hypothetical protein
MQVRDSFMRFGKTAQVVLTYVAHQARIGTATDAWLDLAAVDYFGEDCKRKVGETDFFYRARIKKALLRDAATRGAIRTCILETCESEPRIFELSNSSDAGAYGVLGREGNCPCSGLAYGVTGGWGNLNLPLQFFISVRRPPAPGVAMLAGYGVETGAYGSGSISYVDLSQLPGQVTDENIRSALLSVLPVNVIAWLRIV